MFVSLLWHQFVDDISKHFCTREQCCMTEICDIVVLNIGIDTKIEVIVVSPTTWEAHHCPRAKLEGCGELPGSLVIPQWPKSRYQFLSYHDASKHIEFVQIQMCISLKIAHKTASNQPLSLGIMATDHCHSRFLSYVLVTTVMSQWCLCH